MPRLAAVTMFISARLRRDGAERNQPWSRPLAPLARTKTQSRRRRGMGRRTRRN